MNMQSSLKARVERDHHVLEIGNGWGNLALQLVEQTGCKYTGVNLSKEELKYTQMKVKEAGLEVIILYYIYTTSSNKSIYFFQT